MNYQVMPALTTIEYEELKADIAARGVMVPIEYDELGNVIDGHHRLAICSELNITDYPRVIRVGMTDDEKRTHARNLNIARRHLTQEQRRSLVREQLSETPEKSDRQIAAGLGISNKTVSTARKNMVEKGQLCNLHSSMGADGKTRPRKTVAVFNPTAREEKALKDTNVIDFLASGKSKSVVTAHRRAVRKEKDSRKNAPFTLSESDCKLICADIKNGLPEIPDNSVDFIITDPPYPKKYIPLYETLSKLASRVLVDGGSLLCMCGQSYLDEVINMLTTNMTYHWMLCYLTPGGQAPQLWQKNTLAFWKPVIWLVKGKYKGDLIGDVIKTPPNENDKRYHEWGQSIAGFDEIIQKFTYPGQLILDPFLGGGTTAICAIESGRRFIGADVLQDCLDVTQSRISEVLSYARR